MTTRIIAASRRPLRSRYQAHAPAAPSGISAISVGITGPSGSKAKEIGIAGNQTERDAGKVSAITGTSDNSAAEQNSSAPALRIEASEMPITAASGAMDGRI